jgi:hypothetical protein
VTGSFARSCQCAAAGLLLATLLALTFLDADEAIALGKATYLLANVLGYLYVICCPRRGGISFLVGFFFLFFVAVPAYVQIGSREFPFNSQYADVQLVQGLEILCLAQLAYAAGEALVDLRSGRARPVSSRDQVLRPGFYLRSAAVLVAISVGIIGALGLHAVLLTRSERGAGAPDLVGFNSQLLFIGRSLTLLTMIVLVTIWVTRRELRTRPMVLGLVAAGSTVFLLLNFPPGLARFQLLGSVLALAAVVTSFFRTRTKLLAGMAAPVFLFLFFPAIKALGTGSGVDVGRAFSRDVHSYLLRVDFDVFKQTVDTWIFAQSQPQNHGDSFVGAALFWVPRMWWPGKPRPSGETVAGTLGYGYTNVSSPLPAEGYLAFGLAGALCVMLLAGVLIASVEGRTHRLVRGAPAPQDVLLYALIMGFVVIILRGSLNAVAPMLGTAFLAYLVLSRLHTLTAPPAREAVSRPRAEVLT